MGDTHNHISKYLYDGSIWVHLSNLRIWDVLSNEHYKKHIGNGTRFKAAKCVVHRTYWACSHVQEGLVRTRRQHR